MQTDYKRHWSLDQLADLAEMSRSGFALAFKKTVGMSPLAYLANWRMQIACELLQKGEQSIATIGSHLSNTRKGERSRTSFVYRTTITSPIVRTTSSSSSLRPQA